MSTFAEAESFSADISGWNTGRVVDMNDMVRSRRRSIVHCAQICPQVGCLETLPLTPFPFSEFSFFEPTALMGIQVLGMSAQWSPLRICSAKRI